MEKHLRVVGPGGRRRWVTALSYQEVEEKCREKFSLQNDDKIELLDEENTILDEDAFSVLPDQSEVEMFLNGNLPVKQDKPKQIVAITSQSGIMNCQIGDHNTMINIIKHNKYTKFMKREIDLESIPPNETFISIENSRISPDSRGFIHELEVIVKEYVQNLNTEDNILRALEADNCNFVRNLIFHLQQRYDAFLTKIKRGSFILELFFFDERKIYEIYQRIQEFENYLNATFIPESLSSKNADEFPVFSVRPTATESRYATRNDVFQFSLWKLPQRMTVTDVERVPLHGASYETGQWFDCLQRVTTDLCGAGMENTENTIRVVNQCIKSLFDPRDKDKLDVLNTLLVIERSASMERDNFSAGIASCKDFFNKIEQNSKQGLDEKIGIITFGNEIQTSRFSFDFNSQLKFLENVSQEAAGRSNMIEAFLCSFFAINYFDGDMNPTIPKTQRRIAFISEGKLPGANDKQMMGTLKDALQRENLLVPLHFLHLHQQCEEEIKDFVRQSKGLLIPRHGGRVLGKFNRFQKNPEEYLDGLDYEDNRFVKGETHTLTEIEKPKK